MKQLSQSEIKYLANDREVDNDSITYMLWGQRFDASRDILAGNVLRYHTGIDTRKPPQTYTGWVMGYNPDELHGYLNDIDTEWGISAVWAEDVEAVMWRYPDGLRRIGDCAPREVVVFTGNRHQATQQMIALGAMCCMFAIVSGGIAESVFTGYRGVAAVGAEGRADASGGSSGVAVSGIAGSSFSGLCGVSVTGNAGLAASGRYGFSLAENGTVETGFRGTAFMNGYGKAQAGPEGIIIFQIFNGKKSEIKVLYVGEDGIKPNTYYQYDIDLEKIVEVE